MNQSLTLTSQVKDNKGELKWKKLLNVKNVAQRSHSMKTNKNFMKRKAFQNQKDAESAEN